MPETIKIHACHEHDIPKMWDKLALPEHQPCLICKKEVTKNDVGAFVSLNGKVEVICECLMCFYELKRSHPELS